MDGSHESLRIPHARRPMRRAAMKFGPPSPTRHDLDLMVYRRLPDDLRVVGPAPTLVIADASLEQNWPSLRRLSRLGSLAASRIRFGPALARTGSSNSMAV